MEATELQEYIPKEGFIKKGVAQPADEDLEEEDDDDAFEIGDDDVPKMEANDHKPLADGHSPPLSVEEGKRGEEEILSPLHTPSIPPPPAEPFPSPTPSPKSDALPTSTSPLSSEPAGSSSPISTITTTPAPSSSTSSPAPPASPSRAAPSRPPPSPGSSHSPASSPSLPRAPPSPAPSSHPSSPASPHPSKQLRTTSFLNSSSGGMTPETERKVMTYDERLKMYEDVLQSDILEIALIRELAWQGIPEAKGLRAKYWKILLHYLPTNKMLWDDSLSKSRKLYQDWVKELVIDPHSSGVPADHPLSQERDSRWNAFFRDNEILGEIDKDVKRTFPHLHFFNQVSPTGEEIASPHYHVLKRILFIYAKLNPGIRYVQGMNELLGPIYYTFATDADPVFKEHAEADAFFCFTNLMSEVMDNFCKTLDKSEMGIVGNMKRLNMLFKERDHELWSNLEDKKMNPQFYSFRWITLLLSQEFELPDVLRLWDSLFADPERFNFFYCFCCAMLLCVRERLLNGSFADNLKLLQSYPPMDFQIIFSMALKVHENTYEPPPPRKPENPPSSTSSSSVSHSHSHSHAPSHSHPHPHPPSHPPASNPSNASPTFASKLSLQSLFNKPSPSPPTSKANNNTTTTNNNTNNTKQPEKEKSTFTLPLLGKFQI